MIRWGLPKWEGEEERRQLKARSEVARGQNRLLKEGWKAVYEDWEDVRAISELPSVLQSAARGRTKQSGGGMCRRSPVLDRRWW